MNKFDVTFKLNAEAQFNYSFYAAFNQREYNPYFTLFWSVFGPMDRYNLESWNDSYAY